MIIAHPLLFYTIAVSWPRSSRGGKQLLSPAFQLMLPLLKRLQVYLPSNISPRLTFELTQFCAVYSRQDLSTVSFILAYLRRHNSLLLHVVFCCKCTPLMLRICLYESQSLPLCPSASQLEHFWLSLWTLKRSLILPFVKRALLLLVFTERR